MPLYYSVVIVVSTVGKIDTYTCSIQTIPMVPQFGYALPSFLRVRNSYSVVP